MTLAAPGAAETTTRRRASQGQRWEPRSEPGGPGFETVESDMREAAS
jgi:hypothetical protein